MNTPEISPMVSICCVTYNHEKYIRQCLDGFVMQKTTFPFEVLVHEDASTDNTLEIVKEYEGKYPQLFRCVYQTENQFQKQNVLLNILFPMSRGEYISLCEGDDYWIDPLKLQKQVDFLVANEDYSMCFHEADVLNINSIKTKFNKICKDTDFDFLDLTQSNFISTASVMYRKKNIEKLPSLFGQLPAGDWGLHFLNGQKGKIRYFKDCMSVYRKHEGGVWTSLGANNIILKGVETMKLLDKFFDYTYHEEFQKGIEKRLTRLRPEK